MVRIVLYFVLLLLPMQVSGDTISVAVASNFKDTLKRLADQFEAESGHIIQLSPASSGKHYAQIMHGAPFQLFFSADAERPVLLEQAGFGVPGTRFIYATGETTLWAPASAGDCQDVLKSGAFRRLAVANPRTAPYGVAAEEVIAALQLHAVYSSRVVTGENISQAMQFVDSGAADAGFVATSQWLAHPRREEGCNWHIPAAMVTPLHQEVLLLKRGEKSVAARAFLDFVRSPSARQLITSSGYSVPD